MPVWKQQNSFTGGEISPRLEGRTDLKQYGNSVADLENFFPHSYGGIAKAPGLYFVCETKDSTKTSRLIPFERKIGQAYVIEVGDYYMRFVRDGVLIRLASAPGDYNAGTTYAAGDLCLSVGINYYSRVDGNIGNTPASSPAQWYALEDDIYEIPTPYSEAEIFDISFCQSVDVMWITHEDHPPVRLGRYTETKWVIEDEVFIDGPFQPLNPTTTKMQSSAGTGTVTITADSTAGINNNAGFLSTDVGRFIRIFNVTPDPDEWAVLIITAVTDTTHVTATVESGTAPTLATDIWKLGAFSDSTGYPREVMFFEQRIVYGGTVFEPQGVWLSQTDAYNVFTVSDPIVDSDACQFVLVADQTNDIAWMMASRELAIGTLGGEWTLTGAEGKVISPTSVNAKRYTTNGGANIRPIHVGGSILFVDRSKRAVLEMAYVFEDDGYNAPDLLLLADQITRERQIVDTSWQQSPDSKFYCVMSDGSLAVLTYKRDQDVIGWARRTTQGLFESTTTVSSSYRDVPYFIVNRTINGVTRRFIEWMKADFGDAVEAAGVKATEGVPTGIPDLLVVTQIGYSTRSLGLHGFNYLMEGDDWNPADPTRPQDDYQTYYGQLVQVDNLFVKLCGQIENNTYWFSEEDSTPDRFYIIEKDVFTGVSIQKEIDIDTVTYSTCYGQGVFRTSKTDVTPVLYLCLRKVSDGSYVVHKGSFNGVTDKWEVTPDVSFDFVTDGPSKFTTDTFPSSTSGDGGFRITGNSKCIFIGVQNMYVSALNANQSGVVALDRDDLSYKGLIDTLGSAMNVGTFPTQTSPRITVAANDWMVAFQYGYYKDTWPFTYEADLYLYLTGEDGVWLGEPVDSTRYSVAGQYVPDPLLATPTPPTEQGWAYDMMFYGDKLFIVEGVIQDGNNATYLTHYKANGSSLQFVKSYRPSAQILAAINQGIPIWGVSVEDSINWR